MFTGVPSDLIDTVWDHVKDAISDACKRNRGRYNAQDVYNFLKNKDMQLWVYAPDELQALCITEIINYPKAKVCRICIGTGSKREDWQHFLGEIERWAKSQGCTKVESFARKGWAKSLPSYRLTHVFLEKDI